MVAVGIAERTADNATNSCFSAFLRFFILFPIHYIMTIRESDFYEYKFDIEIPAVFA